MSVKAFEAVARWESPLAVIDLQGEINGSAEDRS